MLNLWNMHPYQLRAANHQVEHPHNFLWLFMGAGKTIITLTSFAHLQRHGAVRASLVVGPTRVVQSVWESEARKWGHTKHLRFSLIQGGTPTQRLRAITTPADIYLVNYENLPWLSSILQHYYINRGTLLPFDHLTLDESTKLKGVETKRMLAMAPLIPYFNYRTGLTGTPASNGLEDLFGQFLVIDGGRRLGTNYYDFVNNYFERQDANGYKYKVSEAGERYIHHVVSDITLELREEDYIKLPDLIVNDVYVDLKPKHRAQYEEFEQLLFTELDNGVELDVDSEVSKINKCLQFSNGAVITNTELRQWQTVHDEKLDALEDILEEAGGEPVLLAYNFKADAARIKQRFKYAIDLTGLSGRKFNDALAAWKAGKVRLLIGHPASMGYGVDGLQDRGRILVWFGLTWSLDFYLQFNARLRRQGQGHPVTCHRILTRNTFDDVVAERLAMKDRSQEALRAAVAAYRERSRFALTG